MTDFDIGDFDNFSGVKYPPKCRKCTFFAIVGFLAVCAGLLWLADYMNPVWNTDYKVKTYARQLCHSSNPPKRGLDDWGNELRMVVIQVDNPPGIRCEVLSLGRDGLLNTDDDIKATVRKNHGF